MVGYTQVYTGNGKGKTTACLGLALRAAGAGLKVYIAQFAKGMGYSELNSICKLSEFITIKQFGRESFINKIPEQEDVAIAREGIDEVKQAVKSGKYNVVILDEINIATHYGLCSVEELLEIIETKPTDVELIISGRNADERIIEIADLVTEMREIKHYYNKGVQARIGIEK